MDDSSGPAFLAFSRHITVDKITINIEIKTKIKSSAYINITIKIRIATKGVLSRNKLGGENKPRASGGKRSLGFKSILINYLLSYPAQNSSGNYPEATGGQSITK
jgi:hypothetical protein